MSNFLLLEDGASLLLLDPAPGALQIEHVLANGAGVLDLGGSAAGKVRVIATAAGLLSLGGSATGKVLLTAQGSGQLGLAGSASGIVVPLFTAPVTVIVIKQRQHFVKITNP